MGIFTDRIENALARHLEKRFDPHEKRDAFGRWSGGGSLSDADRAKIKNGAKVSFYSPKVDREVTGKVIDANFEPGLHKIRSEDGKSGFGTWIVEENHITAVHDAGKKSRR